MKHKQKNKDLIPVLNHSGMEKVVHIYVFKF